MLLQRVTSTAFAIALAATTPIATAQDAANWPNKTVRLLVPFALGGATDIVARILGPGLAEELGQQFIVENRAGAAGNIALEAAAKAAPDGYTILVSNISTSVINATGFADILKVKPLEDLVGVTLLVSIPTLMVTTASLPPNSMKELVDYIKARPGDLNFSNPLGSYSHLDTLDLSGKNGLKPVLIPSKGAGGTVNAIVSGEIHFSFLNAASVMTQVKAGKLKAHATTGQTRMSELPDVPTMAEAGFPGIGSVNWNGLFVPTKTPKPIIDKLFAATVRAMQRPQIREAFVKSFVPVTVSKSPEEFQAYVKTESARWATIIRNNNVRFH
jgi:tripartite-type tricarboxylate transporter receptor subunit TctC